MCFVRESKVTFWFWSFSGVLVHCSFCQSFEKQFQIKTSQKENCNHCQLYNFLFLDYVSLCLCTLYILRWNILYELSRILLPFIFISNKDFSWSRHQVYLAHIVLLGHSIICFPLQNFCIGCHVSSFFPRISVETAFSFYFKRGSHQVYLAHIFLLDRSIAATNFLHKCSSRLQRIFQSRKRKTAPQWEPPRNTNIIRD